MGDGSSDSGKDVYSESVEPVLVSLSNSYFEKDRLSR